MKFTNGQLMQIENFLTLCTGKGNIPTNLAIGHNLRRLKAALEVPRKEVEGDVDMKYYLAQVAHDQSSNDSAASEDVSAEINRESFDVGKEKADAVATAKNHDFEPYKFNMEKLSDTLGSQKLDALLSYVLLMFGQTEE